MNRWNRRLSAVLAMMLLSVGLSGCWNYRELNTLMVVAGAAIDEGIEGHKYHLTLDIANTSSAGKDKPIISSLIESEGDTIIDAVRNAEKRVGMALYWANCQIVVISKPVAQDSILPIVDFLVRENEPRLTIELMVSQEDTAKEILQENSLSNTIASFEIDKIYENASRSQPVAYYQMLYQNYDTLAVTGRALTLPALDIQDNMGQKTATLNGTAIFRRDKLIGFLTAEDTKYFVYVMNQAKGGTLNIKTSTDNTICSFEVHDNKTTIKPTVQGSQLSVSVHTETDVSIAELDEKQDVMDKSQRDAFTADAQFQLQDNIKRIIQMVQQQYGADIFGFGELLHKSDPAVWQSVEKNWDSIFQTIPVDVTSKIKLRNAARNSGPVKVGQ